MGDDGQLVTALGLTKTYGTKAAVSDLDLAIRRGEIYGFLGPNGAGKTTTLRMLLGLVRPTSGSVTVHGRPPGHPEGLARTGALVESPGFYPYLSGRDNLRVLARYAKVDRAQVEAVLDVVQLADRAKDKYSAYSLGMKQRLGVAAALLKDPELLILDEPTNGLDPAGMRDMRILVRDLGAGGRTVLLSSHLMSEVQALCDRVGVIAGGRLVSEGTVEELRGKACLLVVATPLDLARQRAEKLLGRGNVEVVEDHLRLNAAPDQAAEINRELTMAGVVVSELRMAERTLEEVFLELTEAEPTESEGEQEHAG